MRNTIIIFILSILLLSCNSDSGKIKDLSMKIVAESSYLLFPVEDNAPEIVVKIQHSKTNVPITNHIRLAENKIDYWVKLDITNLAGEEIHIFIENTNKNLLGFKNIKQSDTFEFDYNEPYRPLYHFTPEYGWMNDPNGMVYLDGEYHLFFQYNPFGTKWQNMHWGHAVSTDLTSWTYLPVAIAPDTLGAIFSGSAVIDVNNTAGFGKNAMIAIYTSAGKEQSQSIAYSTDKGRTFTKYEGNPVIPNPGIPDFRDPKVFWHNESAQWIMSLATKQTITFYGSVNLKDWQKLSEFGDGIGSHGGVWECPDLIPMTYNGKTKWVLLVSINPGGPNGGSATQYFIGNFDGTNFTADALPYPLWLDYGRDNYAGVTWSDVPESDGRKIFMGWMSNWDYANNVPTQNFRSAMTVARDLKITNNGKHLVVANYPVNEMLSLRAKTTEHPTISVNNNYEINNILENNEGAYEIELTILPQNSLHFGFKLNNNKGEELEFRFDLSTQFFSIHRDKSGLVDFDGRFASGMNAPLVKNSKYRVRLLIDKSSAEIFINEGELALSTIFFPTENMNHLTLYSKDYNIRVENIQFHNLK